MQLLTERHSSREIARRLHLSLNAVESYRRNIIRKLDVNSIAELTRYAVREGLTSVSRPNVPRLPGAPPYFSRPEYRKSGTRLPGFGDWLAARRGASCTREGQQTESRRSREEQAG